LIVADQFPYNFLARYKDKFQSGGLRLLMDQGAQYPSCTYKCATTHSAVGASIISSGAHPWNTAVVGNTWYSRSKKGPTSATTDDAELIGANGTAGSCKLSGTTIGDQMKLATNGRSKVFAIGTEQSPSLLLAGRLANNAFWIDPKTGNMVTSAKYGRTLTGWVKAFNDTHPADKYLGKPWQRLLPENQYAASTKDDYPYERSAPGDGKVFPHVIQAGSQSAGQDYYEHFVNSPFANQTAIEFAREAVEKEFLGQHPDPDLLILSLGAGEKLAQAYGPYSQETQDLVLRMDQSLAQLFQFINEKVGFNKTTIIFTATHGSPAIPEFSKERGLDSGRIDPKVFTSFLDSKLDSQVGHEDWIEAFDPPNLYLNLDAIDRQKLRQPDVESLVGRIAHSVPGIGEVFTAWQLYTNQPPNSPLSDSVRKAYFFGRSGEVYVTPKPGFIFSSESTGTGYGSPFTYDSQVPLLLFGAGVRAGRYGANVSPADIAPTISAVLGIEAPSDLEGTPLAEAIAQPSVQSAPRQETRPVVEEDDKNKRKRK
jgi:predicted AlkP superfamily pyrophosphatase or phosphodiesterase